MLEEYSGELYDSHSDSDFNCNIDPDWLVSGKGGKDEPQHYRGKGLDINTGDYTNDLRIEESNSESKEEENIEQLERKDKEDVQESERKEDDYIDDSESKEEEDTRGELRLLVKEAKQMLSELKEFMKDPTFSEVVASPAKVGKMSEL